MTTPTTISTTEKCNKHKDKFSCIVCDFYTSNRYDYNRHLLTRKHKTTQSDNVVVDEPLEKTQHHNNNPIEYSNNSQQHNNQQNVSLEKTQAEYLENTPIQNTLHIEQIKKSQPHNITEPRKLSYDCPKCNKPHNDRAGLWRHKKKCAPNSELVYENTLQPTEEITQTTLNVNVLLDLLKQNKEFQNYLVDQNKKLMEQNAELVKNSNNAVTNSNNTNTINNTNSFNLTFFLNEQCKNAINMSDFMDTLPITINDLKRTGELGYVEGISSIFLKALNELDVHSRPIHCTDLKRETVYVKNQNKWEKESEDKPTLKKAIKKAAMKNLRQLPQWEAEHPEFMDTTSEESDYYIVLTQRLMGGTNKQEDDKFENSIIKAVLKNVAVDARGNRGINIC